LGLCTYYRRFVPDFSHIAKPLHRLTEKGQQFHWSPECENAFLTLKRNLVSAPILSYPNPDQTFIIDTDASNTGMGAVLSQVQDGVEKVIAYFSKTLSKPERNYCATRKELLAIVTSIDHFHHYLYGRNFLLRTDHAALRWLLNFKTPEGQLARWIQKLQQYDFEIQHRRGKSHGNADALSRRPCSDKCKHCSRAEEHYSYGEMKQVSEIISTPDPWSPSEIRKCQLEDKDIKPIIDWKEKSERPSWQEVSPLSTITKCYWAQWDSLELKEGVLYRRWESEDGKNTRLQMVLPKSRVQTVLQETHNGSTGGHFGVNKTLAKTRQRFYWAKNREDVEKWCKQCDACASKKGPRTRSKGKLQIYNVGAPFERIAIDVMGPLPRTDNENRYLLVVMDYFTKWPEVYPIKDQEAETVAEALVNNFISRFGVPQELHSDQGRNFESKLFRGMCNLLGINKTRTTPLHPQSDGMVERFNRTLSQHLALYVDDHQRDWDKHLPLFLLAYRSATHETTGHTPSMLLFGREVRLPIDLVTGRPNDIPLGVDEYTDNLQKKLEDVHHYVRDRIKLTSRRMKTRYDVHASGPLFKEGDLVWLYNPQRKKGFSPKLQRHWEGPYKIVKRVNDVVYRIQRGSSKCKIVHVDRLSPYHGRDQNTSMPGFSVRDEQN
jgi:hypothetical protein